MLESGLKSALIRAIIRSFSSYFADFISSIYLASSFYFSKSSPSVGDFFTRHSLFSCSVNLDLTWVW